MPFRSKEQMQYMFKFHPEIARRWADEMKAENGGEKGNIFKRLPNKKKPEGPDEKVMGRSFQKAASLESYAFEDDLSLLAEDSMIDKVAGIFLTDTTPEGIEQFIKEYMMNETSFFPEKLDMQVDLLPLSSQSSGGPMPATKIDNANGVLHVMYSGVPIDFPFIIRDAQMMPFDMIQMGKERSVYTRENLKRVLFGLAAQIRERAMNPNAGTSLDPYVKTDKFTGPLTDTGFLNDTLRVQELARSYGDAGVSAYASIYQEIDNLLEKTAQIEQIHIDYNKLQQKLVEEYKPKLQKMAADIKYDFDEEEQILKTAIYDKLENPRFVDVHKVPNATKVLFPERDGNELSMTRAMVFKDFVNGAGIKPGRALVVTADRRYIDLQNYSPALVRMEDQMDWDFKTFPGNGLKPGYMYTAILTKGAFLPFTIHKTKLGSEHLLRMDFAHYCIDIDGNKFMLVANTDETPGLIQFLSRQKAYALLTKDEPSEKHVFYEMMLKPGVPVVLLPKNTPFIHILGTADRYLRKNKELFMPSISSKSMNVPAAYTDFFKVASMQNYVKLVLTSRDQPHIFNMEVRWIDLRTNPPSDRKVEFSSINENQVKSALVTMGMGMIEVVDTVQRASREGTGFYELHIGRNKPWLLKPEMGARTYADTFITRMRDAFFNKDTAVALAASLAGGAASAAVGALGGQGLQDMHAGMGHFASEAKALSQKLEKLAQAKKSVSLLKLASLMTSTTRIYKVLDEAITKNAEFDGVQEALESLTKVAKFLPVLANDVIAFKGHQLKEANELVSYNTLHRVLEHMDNLHKLAYNPQMPGDKEFPFASSNATPKNGIARAAENARLFHVGTNNRSAQHEGLQSAMGDMLGDAQAKRGNPQPQPSLSKADSLYARVKKAPPPEGLAASIMATPPATQVPAPMSAAPSPMSAAPSPMAAASSAPAPVPTALAPAPAAQAKPLAAAAVSKAKPAPLAAVPQLPDPGKPLALPAPGPMAAQAPEPLTQAVVSKAKNTHNPTTAVLQAADGHGAARRAAGHYIDKVESLDLGNGASKAVAKFGPLAEHATSAAEKSPGLLGSITKFPRLAGIAAVGGGLLAGKAIADHQKKKKQEQMSQFY